MIDHTPACADPAFEALRFDPLDYIEHLRGIEMADEDARAFLEALWNIMVAFVDLGFEIEPAGGPVGQIVKAAIALEAESRGLLDSDDNTHNRNDDEMVGQAQAVPSGMEDS